MATLPVAAALCRCLDFGEGCDAYQPMVKAVLDKSGHDAELVKLTSLAGKTPWLEK